MKEEVKDKDERWEILRDEKGKKKWMENKKLIMEGEVERKRERVNKQKRPYLFLFLNNIMRSPNYFQNMIINLINF